jgi:hypothetical protein
MSGQLLDASRHARRMETFTARSALAGSSDVNDTRRMNAVVVIDTVRARDGKRHPVEPVSPDQAKLVKIAVHRLVCGQGLSIRAAQRELAAQYGLRRSIGRIWAILHDYTCSRCRPADDSD